MGSLPKKEKVKKLESEDKVLAQEKRIEKDIQKNEGILKRLMIWKRIRAPTKAEAKKRRRKALEGVK